MVRVTILRLWSLVVVCFLATALAAAEASTPAVVADAVAAPHIAVAAVAAAVAEAAEASEPGIDLVADLAGTDAAVADTAPSAPHVHSAAEPEPGYTHLSAPEAAAP